MNSRTLLAHNFGLILAGIFSAAFGLKEFLLSSHFIDGGATADASGGMGKKRVLH